MRTHNHTFTSARGNTVQVFQDHADATSRSGFAARGSVTRTWAVVNGTEVEVETGCAFRAPSAVAAHGF